MTSTAGTLAAPLTRPVPSECQRRAIETRLGPVLVLAGPGAGKTFCLIERVRHLLEKEGFRPDEICAVTFTNRAALELADRLRREVGPEADRITRSTIHSLCVRILREHGAPLGLERGFGIADEEYQREILTRLLVPARWRSSLLNRFTLHRVAGRELAPDDAAFYARYRAFLARRRLVDFDDLVLLVRRLFDEHPDVAAQVARQWRYVLVDEFQDLNPAQYAIIHRLAREHLNLFGVGDDEQSIFSWTGADPRVLERFANDFGVRERLVLDRNHRTARHIFDMARRFVSANPHRMDKTLSAPRESAYPIEARGFADDTAEARWLLDDLARDRDASGLPWGEFALLYRRHRIGEELEATLMQAGIPCRLAQGRAVGDDPVIRYLVAALKVIAHPGDAIHAEGFVRLVLPGTLLDRLRADARGRAMGFMPSIRARARELPLADQDGRKLRRALTAMNNLKTLGHRHGSLAALVDEILSQRVGPYRTLLEDRADELTDPASHPAAVALARAIEHGREQRARILIPPAGGLEIGLAGLLSGAGAGPVDYLLPGVAIDPRDLVLAPGSGGPLGLALGTFKALQLVASRAQAVFRDFVAVDLETTDRDAATAEIVEIAAARVRDWEIVDEFHSLVKPRVAIAPGASDTHGYADADVADAPGFEEVWPRFRAFAGHDVLVAHNGYTFDFPILRRMAREMGGTDFEMYDTLPLARWLRLGSARLELLAERFGIDPGTPHKGMWDVRTLVKVFRKLEEEKTARARRVALAHLLDHLGVALALSDPDTLGPEAELLREATRPYALGRYSSCLDFYRVERERVGPSAATVEALIDRLGGVALMERVRTERRSDQRYPAAMARLRRLMQGIESGSITEQIQELLGRIALSRSDDATPERDRVNLLTLHATKGLEFSRVYVVGVEDAELPGAPGGQGVSAEELEESRRLLYVGMTRARDRLVFTRVAARSGRPTGGTRFLTEMELDPETGA